MIRGNSQLVALGALLLLGCGSADDGADGPAQVSIHVIASATNSNLYAALERPFWTEVLPAASGGRISVDLSSMTESNLKGPEIARLLSAGALDVAYANFSAIAGDLREFEGLDLSGVITDLETLHRASDAYKPVIDRIFAEHGIKLLGLFPYPEYAFYCSGTVTSLDDLSGKKVRVTTQSMSDFLLQLGAVPVSIPFIDVLPALQTGVADCAVTGTYSGNVAGWHEVTDSLYTLPIGSGVAFYGYSARGWNNLEESLRDLIESEFASFENEAWALTKRQTQNGINCNTGVGECIDGTPSDMQHFEPSSSDIARAREIAKAVVIPTWAERCGVTCVADWNATVGQVADIEIETGE